MAGDDWNTEWNRISLEIDMEWFDDVRFGGNALVIVSDVGYCTHCAVDCMGKSRFLDYG